MDARPTVSKFSKLKIAVIGAGASGVFAVRFLKGKGYEHVSLFESEPFIGGKAKTYEIDERTYDLGPRYISSGGLNRAKISRRLKKILESLEIRPKKAPLFKYYNPSNLKFETLPPYLKRKSKIKLTQVYAQAYQYVYRVGKYSDVREVYKSGLAKRHENVYSWANRHNMADFGELIGFGSDAMLNGPTHDRPVGYSLMSEYFNVANHFKKILGDGFGFERRLDLLLSRLIQLKNFLSNKPDFLSAELIRFIKRKPAKTEFLEIKGGFTHLLKNIISQNSIKPHLEHKLISIKPGPENGVELIFENGESLFYDKVILAVPPPVVSSVCASFPAIQELFDVIETKDRVESFVFRVTSWPKAAGAKGTIINVPRIFFQETDEEDEEYTTLKTEVDWDGVPIQIIKEYSNSNIIVGHCYNQNNLSKEEILERFKAGLSQMDVEMGEVLGHEGNVHPYFVPTEEIKASWFSRAQDMQGKHQVYFAGEIFGGPGISPSLNYVEKSLPKWF